MFDFDILNKNEEHTQVVSNPFDSASLVRGFDIFRSQIAEMQSKANIHDVTDDLTNEAAVLMTNQAKQLEKAIESKRVELKEPYLAVTKVLDGETKTLKDALVSVQSTLSGKIRPYLQEKERIRQEAERKAREEAERIRSEQEAEARRIAEEEVWKRYEDEKAERECILAERKAVMDSEAAKRAEQKAIEAEKQAKEYAERKAKEEAEKAAALVPEIVHEVPDAIKTVTNAGTADLKLEWDWEIIDFKALPDEVISARFEELVKAVRPQLNAMVKAGIRNVSGVRFFQKQTLKTRSK